MSPTQNIYLNLIVELLRVVVIVIFCHFTGDYLLLTGQINKKKSTSFWFLIIHCFCYCSPFLFYFGVRWQLGVIFAVHLIVDWMNEWKGWIGTFYDQYFHIVAALTYIFPVLSSGSWRIINI